MKPLLRKIKPASGFSHFFHVILRILLPVTVFILVRLSIGFGPPLAVILLSKWRIFAVKPRFWLATLRANAVDIMVGVSILLFMTHTDSAALQLLYTVLYAIWLVRIKPASTTFTVSLQAAIGQFCALSALFLAWPTAPAWGLVAASGFICYLVARHFFDSFDEPYAKMLAGLWGYFGAGLLWVLGHMLVVYPRHSAVLAMPTLLLTAIGYSLGAVYYLDHYDRLSGLIRKELLFIAGSIVLVLVCSLYYEGTHLIV